MSLFDKFLALVNVPTVKDEEIRMNDFQDDAISGLALLMEDEQIDDPEEALTLAFTELKKNNGWIERLDP